MAICERCGKELGYFGQSIFRSKKGKTFILCSRCYDIVTDAEKKNIDIDFKRIEEKKINKSIQKPISIPKRRLISEFLIVWIILFLIYFRWQLSQEEMEIAFIVSLYMGTIFSIAIYWGLYEGRKQIRMKNATEEEIRKMKEKERKMNRIALYILLALIIFIVVIIGMAFLSSI
ncbi:MAG: hypothetical protein V1726_01285 [Methanobacteriota archaeon]